MKKNENTEVQKHIAKAFKRTVGNRPIHIIGTRKATRRSPFGFVGYAVLIAKGNKIQNISTMVSDLTGLKWLNEDAVEAGYNYSIKQAVENITQPVRFNWVML